MARPTNPRDPKNLISSPSVAGQPGEVKMIQKPLWVDAGGVNTLSRGLAVGDNQAMRIRNFTVSDDKRFESRRGTDLMGQESLYPVLQVFDFARASGKKNAVRFTPFTIEVYDYLLDTWQPYSLPFHGNDRDLFCWTGWADKIVFSNGIDGMWEFDFANRVAKQIPGAPSCRGLTTFNNMIVASHVNGVPYRIAWSQKDNYLIWDETLPDPAGHEDLFGAPGGLVDEAMGVFPFTDEAAWLVRSRSIWQMSVSGSSIAPFRFSRVISDLGTTNRHGIVQTPAGLILPSQRSFYQITPQGTQEIGQLIKTEFYLGNSNDVLGTKDAYATFDAHRNEYRIALRQFVYRYRTDFGTWTVDEYPWYIRSLSRELQGRTSVQINQLAGSIDSLQGSIDDLGGSYFSYAMMFALTDDPVVMREGNTPSDVLPDNSRVSVETLIESGEIKPDPLLAVELLELQLEHESQTTQDLVFHITRDDGNTWIPVSNKTITPTTGPDVVFVKTSQVSSKFRVRIHSGELGQLKVLGLYPSIVTVSRSMARKRLTPHSIEVFPTPLTLNVGETKQLTAVVRDIAGNIIVGAAVAFSSQSIAKASVNSLGVVTGIAAGITTITVSYAGLTAVVPLTVNAVAPIPVASITITPTPSTAQVGSTIQFTAIPKDALGTPLTGRTITWGVVGSFASISSTGLATMLAAGVESISASCDGVIALVTLTVVASAPVPASVSVTPSLGSLSVGQSKQLTATVTDGSGNVIPGAVVVWSSSDDTRATVTQAGLVTATGTGSVTITATIGLISGSTTGTVIAVVVPVAQVIISPTSLAISQGQTAQLTATTRDSSGNVLTGRVVTWVSSNTSIATVDSTGFVTAIGVGAATITATSEGVSSSVNASVSAVAVASVSLLPLFISLNVGQSQQLTAVVKDASNNVLVGRPITWASANPAVATVSSTGLVTAIGAGSTTVIATCQGVNSNSCTVGISAGTSITWRSPYHPQPVGTTFDNSDASFGGEVVAIPAIPARFLNGGAAHVHWVGNAGDAPVGSTVYANSMGGFRTAATAFARGDVIVCQSFNVHSQAISETALTTTTIPSKGAATGVDADYLYIMSSAVYFGTFPRIEKERVAFDGADAPHMATLSFDYTGASYDLSAFIQFASSDTCSYVRMVGLNIRTTRPEPGGVLGRVYVNDLIRIGSTLSSLQSQVPHHLTFDRCWIHGSWDTTSLKNCVSINGDDIAIIGSEIGEAYNYGQESHAIIGINCNGRWQVENTLLRDASNLFLIGGAGPALGSPYYPQDIWLKDCYFYRDPASKGGHARVQQVKNAVETKFGGRVMVTGFVIDGLWEGGQFNAFVFKTTVQNGQAYTWVQTHDVIVWHGIIRNVPEPWNVAGRTEAATKNNANIDFFNIRVEPTDEGIFTVSGTSGAAGRYVGPMDNVSVEHCTLPMSFSTATGTPGFFTVVSGNGNLTGFKYRNNIGMKQPPVVSGGAPYSVIDSTTGPKNKAALDAACGVGNYDWSYNLITDAENPAALPQGNGNKYTTAGTSGGTTLRRADIHFVSDPSPHAYGNWRLQPSSPGYQAASDGRDMGCLNDEVEAFTARALSGAAA